jgi:hypothetical protein
MALEKCEISHGYLQSKGTAFREQPQIKDAKMCQKEVEERRVAMVGKLFLERCLICPGLA